MQAIEKILPGDKVLSQDVTQGTLGFQTVLVVHNNPPTATLKVNFEGGQCIVPSTYHRLWIAGQGWKQARELKVGDLVRTLSGVSKVARIEKGETIPVYNLDVASNHTFFAGGIDCLVHDNTVPESTDKPFDSVH